MSLKTVFVTVGSTKFELLINTILKSDVLNLLKKYSFKRVILQVGSGKHDDDDLFNFTETSFNANNKEVANFTKEDLEIIAYRYKSSIKDDMQSADLVISHAGSGSVMESLEANKKLIVVVNEALMDNHQLELAEKMYEEGYLLYTNCKGISDKIELINSNEFSLTKYTPGNSRPFGIHLRKLIE